MRFPKLILVLVAVVAVAAASSPAQLLPGYIVVGANDGNLYMVSGKGGVVNTFASVGASVYGLDEPEPAHPVPMKSGERFCAWWAPCASFEGAS